MQKYTADINKINKIFAADRGDVRRVIKIPHIKTDMETQMSEEHLGGRGDVTEQNPGKSVRSASPALTTCFFKEPNNQPRINRKRSPNNIKEEKAVTPLTIDRRREIARMYTFKRCEDNMNDTKKGKSPKEQSPGRGEKDCMRFEMDVKTLIHKEDSIKMYKAVSFKENRKSVPLRLVLPAKIRQTTRNRSPISDTSERTSLSEVSCNTRDYVKNKHKQKQACPLWSPLSKAESRNYIQKVTSKRKPKNRTRRRRKSSPDAKSPEIPLTQIAKWNPDVINEFTKPYYEAWVNTTLSAVSRNSDPKMVKEKQQIIQQFQQVLDNPPPILTPEDFTDEKFTGKIRIRHKKE